MAVINCPECNKKVSDKTQQCPHCDFAIGEVSEEKLESLNRIKKIKRMQRLTTQSFIAIILFAAGFTWMYWHEPEPESIELYVSQAAIAIGVIWYLVNRVRLIISKKKS
ncbi:zinc ribbon domain-containing protein [Flocculibacter collagenilyticus]|uniref:zinc ribbon domain-containing protein n=1 Tax=Flocculibacter collagenilyticus TaxID=2744479 RepID=UPI0018F4CD7E|nr:zinc ribbon domain-containing protein [Flocculibacter collagenilyticus]